jgi:hypothetical protein
VGKIAMVEEEEASPEKKKKRHWFDELKSREALGGKKRDAKTMGFLAAAGAAAAHAALHGRQLASNNPHYEKETIGDGVDSAPKYQHPAEYLALQETLVRGRRPNSGPGSPCRCS